MSKTKSGRYWIRWADIHAPNSEKVDDLAEPFRSTVKAFIAALQAAGASISVESTKRDAKRAYLFHWAWRIGLGKVLASKATHMAGVPIDWDHGSNRLSKAAAKEMIEGFELAVPPASKVAPALKSNHISGKAIDMKIEWDGELHVTGKDGKVYKIRYHANPNHNTRLHTVGATYKVKKHKRDKPHWSVDGK